MTDEEVSELATEWIKYFLTDRSEMEEWDKFDATGKVLDLQFERRGEDIWQLILEIHRQDQSIKIQQALSAGPIEDLLAEHGDQFIGRVEEEARRDPSFAKVLGGVWKSEMSDEVWNRLQAVWDRSGWDGIPE